MPLGFTSVRAAPLGGVVPRPRAAASLGMECIRWEGCAPSVSAREGPVKGRGVASPVNAASVLRLS